MADILYIIMDLLWRGMRLLQLLMTRLHYKAQVCMACLFRTRTSFLAHTIYYSMYTHPIIELFYTQLERALQVN